MSPKKTSASVQIRLTGEDAELYSLIMNKKAFLVAALRMFHQDEKLRPAFFNNSNSDTIATTQNQTVQKSMSKTPSTEETQQTRQEEPKAAVPRGSKLW